MQNGHLLMRTIFTIKSTEDLKSNINQDQLLPGANTKSLEAKKTNLCN